jgi:hypothetical protein
MSAAATAAGYLYASGRLRGRAAREQEEAQPKTQKPAARERIRVAVLEPEQGRQETQDRQERQEKPRREPKIEYRVRRRWSAGAE